MDGYIWAVVFEAGIPGVISLFCFLCLLVRAIRILRAGLVYNTDIPKILIAKKIILWVWVALTVLLLVALFVGPSNLGQHSGEESHFYWLE